MSQIRTWKHLLLLSISILFWAFSPAISLAQTLPCGNIIGFEETVPVSDCENPFGVSHDPSPFVLEIDGIEVSDESQIFIKREGTESYFVFNDNVFDIKSDFYLHDGNDYRLVDTGYVEITESDVRQFAESFFEDGLDPEMYIQNYLGSGTDIDEEVFDYELFYRFLVFVDDSFVYKQKPLLPGTYTLITQENSIQLNKTETLYEKFKKIFVKTAHAESYPDNPKFALTFTLREDSKLAPSIMFLPGIMGSRLYEESDVCNVFGGVDKVERWVSTYDCDIERLAMDENGHSVYPLFTETEGGIIEDVAIISNLYDSFFEDLADWKDNGLIADYSGVPYDWRLKLDDILKTVNVGGRISFDPSANYKDSYIYASLSKMINASPKKKVVLVGHSNGGLVIKTLLATMKANNDPFLDSIEKVILVAVPQAGTPEAVEGLLHGVEVGLMGAAFSEEQARQFLNTSPFGYHLLPGEEYFNMVSTPIIAIEEGTSTSAWREQFGAEIKTFNGLNNFLSKDSNRTTPAWDDVDTPATAYPQLINYSKDIHNFMKGWKPEGTLVYEVAGTGIYTPATINYFTDTKCIEAIVSDNGVVACNKTGPILGRRVSKVIDGDGTVVVPGALSLSGSEGSEKWYLDLDEYDSFINTQRIHKNIFEVQDVRDFILGRASDSIFSDYDFVSKTEPSFEGKTRLVYQLHSPLDLYVVLDDGQVVGSTTPFIRGVEYSRYGEVQQLSIPDEETDYEVRLSGVATGSFTFDIDSYSDDNLIDRKTYSAIPSSTSTQVLLKTEEGKDPVLEIDYQGDGIFEAVALPGLSMVVPITSTSTNDMLEIRSGSSGTKIGLRTLPSVPMGELTGEEIVTTKEYELMLQLINLLTQYRDLLIKRKIQ